MGQFDVKWQKLVMHGVSDLPLPPRASRVPRMDPTREGDKAVKTSKAAARPSDPQIYRSTGEHLLHCTTTSNVDTVSKWNGTRTLWLRVKCRDPAKQSLDMVGKCEGVESGSNPQFCV